MPVKRRRKFRPETRARRATRTVEMLARGFVDVARAAEIASVAPETVHGWVRRAVVASTKDRGKVYVNLVSLNAHLGIE